MIFNHQNHDFLEKKFGVSRLVFVEQRKRNEDNSEKFELKKGVENHNFDLQKYEAHLDEAIRKNKLQASEKESLMAVARRDEEENKKNEEKEKSAAVAKKIREKLEQKEKRGDLKKIEISATENIEKGNIENFATLREFVRTEIRRLGVDFNDEKKEELDAFLEFEERILERIQAVLRTSRKHQNILDEAEKEKKLAKTVWSRMKNIFQDKNKRELFEFLRKQNFPSGEQSTINQFVELAKEAETNKTFDKTDTLVGTFDPLKLNNLLDRINAIERFYQNWEKNIDPNKFDLSERINNYSKNLDVLGQEIEANKILPIPDWKQISADRKADIEIAEKMLKEKDDLFSRRFVSTLLEEGETQIEELKKLVDNFEEEENKKTTPPSAEPEKAEEEKEEIEETTAEKLRKFSEMGEEETDGFFGHINANLMKFVTANRRITWYSWYDITEALKGIREAMTKHMESVSEDKRGDISKGLMFWRPVIQKRIADMDIAGEKSRCEEEKKFYENKTDKQMIAELGTLPAMDKRRAILETLADRGSLDFANRKLMNIVSPSSLSDSDWESAEESADYTLMKHAFAKSIDTYFIQEVGYGDKLIQMQVSGAKKGEDENKDKCNRYGSLTAASEMNLLQTTLEKGSIDGEYRYRGNIYALLGTGSAHSGNGESTDVFLRVNGKNQKFNLEADLGTVMVILVDAFLKGQISRENLMSFGLAHEGGMMAFAGIEDVLASRGEESRMHQWGWIEGADGRGGSLTDFGVEQIRNYFNTRAAKIKKPDGTEGYTHIASDNGTYIRHTQRRGSIKEMRGLGDGVCDKFTSYFMKSAREDLYDDATTANLDGRFSVETTDIASMIKSCLEDIQDGVSIHASGDYATEMATGLEVKKHPNGEEYVEDKESDQPGAKTIKRPAQGKIQRFGEARIDRGSRNLVKMLRNLHFSSRDRSIIGKNCQYEDTFLEKYVLKKLEPIKNDIPEYRNIVRSLKRLTQEDPPSEEEIQNFRSQQRGGRGMGGMPI